MSCSFSFSRFKIGLLVAALAATMSLYTTDKQATERHPPEKTHPVDFLVQFESTPLSDSALRAMELSVWRPNDAPFGIHRLVADKEVGDDDKLTLLHQLQRTPGIRSAQFNHVIQRRGWPNDPLVTAQWHHVQNNDVDLDSDSAWSISTGGVNPLGHHPVIAIIEGFDADHPEFSGQIELNEDEVPNNLIDDDGNGYIDDHLGWNPWTQTDIIAQDDHGTAVAGMAGAASGNAFQGAGLAPEAKLMRIDIGPLTEADVIASYAYARDRRRNFNETQGESGAFVVATNASWGIDYANPDDHPLWCAIYDSLLEVGILNVAATANLSINVDLLGDMPTGCTSLGLLSVTATDSLDMRSQAAFGAESIDLGAPGKHLLLPTGWSSPADSSMSVWSGTSFASPAVAGGVALLYGAPCPEFAGQAISQPQLAALRVRNAILAGTDATEDLMGTTASGGRFNALGALSALMSECLDVDTVGCTWAGACNYNVFATVDDGSCDLSSCYGCTDPSACNYSPSASLNDGSCTSPSSGYDCDGNCQYPTERASSLAGGEWDEWTFEASGTCTGWDLTLYVENMTGAWASDQLLFLESPNGEVVQMTGLSPLNAANFPSNIAAANVTFSGGVPLQWATNSLGNFTSSMTNLAVTGTGTWTLHATNTWSGEESSELQWSLGLSGLCPIPEGTCALDSNGDGWIGIADIIALLSNWGCLEECPGDITGDGAVSSADLTLILTGFGESCIYFDE